MTLQEMEQAFDSEWVLMGETEIDEVLEVIKGRVLCHSKDRDEVYRAAVRLRPERSAILYTGEIPPNAAILQ